MTNTVTTNTGTRSRSHPLKEDELIPAAATLIWTTTDVCECIAGHRDHEDIKLNTTDTTVLAKALERALTSKGVGPGPASAGSERALSEMGIQTDGDHDEYDNEDLCDDQLMCRILVRLRAFGSPPPHQPGKQARGNSRSHQGSTHLAEHGWLG